MKLKNLKNSPEWKALKNLKALLWRRMQRMAGPIFPKQVISSWDGEHFVKLCKFQEIHKGEDCFIVGNGPSLNRTELEKLQGKHVFGLNKIFLIYDRVPLDLSYLISVNRLVIQQSKEIFQGMEHPVFLAGDAARDLNAFGDNIVHLNCNGRLDFRTHMSHSLSEGFTVTYVAMQVAFAMGFQRVFLIGVDHSFQQVGTANEEQTLEGDDINHFDKSYFKGQKWHLADLDGSELAYRNALFWYRKYGREIYDATVDGKLEVFPKISFDEAVSMCSDRKKQPLRLS